MSIGIHVYDIDGPDVVELAKAAEAAGFGTLWLGEHAMIPIGFSSTHPGDDDAVAAPVISPDTALADPMVALAAAAQATSTLRIAAGIYLLTLRHPILTARAAMTLSRLSGERLLFGVAAGWLEEEFTALGVPFAQRYGRFEESVGILRAAWHGGPFEHHGEFYDFGRVQVAREPARIPLVLGGNGPRALRRAALLGDGWLSSGTPSFAELAGFRDVIRQAREQAGLESAFSLHCRVSTCTPSDAERYLAAGFDEVVVSGANYWPAEGSPEEKRDRFRTAAAGLGLR